MLIYRKLCQLGCCLTVSMQKIPVMSFLIEGSLLSFGGIIVLIKLAFSALLIYPLYKDNVEKSNKIYSSPKQKLSNLQCNAKIKSEHYLYLNV